MYTHAHICTYTHIVYTRLTAGHEIVAMHVLWLRLISHAFLLWASVTSNQTKLLDSGLYDIVVIGC